MEKLINKLAKADIPYELRVLYDTIQVWYPSVKNNVADVVCHEWSMGNKDGLLEIMGLVDETKTGDVVEGYLTADEIFERIAKHYRTHKTAEEVKTNAEADWIDYLYTDDATGEDFLVEVRATDTADDDAEEIAWANFESPRLIEIISVEEAEWLGLDTY
jgi:hypothetical protein